MPVAVPLAPLLAALLAAILAIAGTLILLHLLRGLARTVPVVGDYIADAAGSAIRRIDAAWRRAARARVRPLVRFVNGTASVVFDLSRGLRAYAVALPSAIRFLAAVKVPRMIRAAARRLRRAIARVARQVRAVARSLARLRRAIRLRFRALVRWIRRAIVVPLRHLIRVTIPRLRRELLAAIAALALYVRRIVLPRIRAIELDVRNLWRVVRGLQRDLLRLSRWALPILAVFSAAQVISLLRHVRICRSRTRRLCRVDLPELEDLLGFAFAGLTLAQIVALVRAHQQWAGEIEDDLRRLIDL